MSKHFHFKLFKQLYITIQFSVSAVSMSKTVLFQTIQFSMSTQLNCQTFLFQAIQLRQTVLIQLIQFSKAVSINIDFVYTQLNVKAVL